MSHEAKFSFHFPWFGLDLDRVTRSDSGSIEEVASHLTRSQRCQYRVRCLLVVSIEV